MDAKCLTRKRIWEIDCLSLDAAIAASFEFFDKGDRSRSWLRPAPFL